MSRLLELEGLRAAVNAKLGLWRTLQTLAPKEPRLQGFDFAQLDAQAQSQVARIDEWHQQAALHSVAQPAVA